MMTSAMSSRRPAPLRDSRLPDDQCGLHESGRLCTHVAPLFGSPIPHNFSLNRKTQATPERQPARAFYRCGNHHFTLDFPSFSRFPTYSVAPESVLTSVAASALLQLKTKLNKSRIFSSTEYARPC